MQESEKRETFEGWCLFELGAGAFDDDDEPA
jgi:hypothetical protein